VAKREPFSRLERDAERQMAENRARIEGTVRGTPSGKGFSTHTTDPKGYRLIKAKYPGSCLACRRHIKVGTQVRYWFGHGVTCRGCNTT
jgi:hypothetical protein